MKHLIKTYDNQLRHDGFFTIDYANNREWVAKKDVFVCTTCKTLHFTEKDTGYTPWKCEQGCGETIQRFYTKSEW